MSGVEHTITKVSDEALDEMLSNLSEGKVDAEKLIAARLNETLVEVQKIQEYEHRQAEALRRQIIGAAEMSARNKSLELVEENLNLSFAEAAEKLKAFTQNDQEENYKRVLKSLVTEAVDQVGGADFVVQGNENDQGKLRGIVSEVSKEKRARVALDPQTIKSIGGVKVRSKDNYVMFDNTFEARLERLKPALRREIAQLFSEAKQKQQQ